MRNPILLTALALGVLMSAPASAQGTFDRPIRECIVADASPNTDDLQRFINCAWNYITWDEESIVRPAIVSAMIEGNDVTIFEFLVCGVPGPTPEPNSHCVLVEAQVEFSDEGLGVGIADEIPFLDIDFGNFPIWFTRTPRQIVIRVTRADGVQLTREYPIGHPQLPETPPGLPYPDGHIYIPPDTSTGGNTGGNNNPPPGHPGGCPPFGEIP